MDQNTIKSLYPLHYLVWCNKKEPLQRHLATIAPGSDQLEVKDPRGRTPLMLSVTLGHKACASLLVKHGARVDTEDVFGFTVFQEAIVGRNIKFCRYLDAKYSQQMYHNLANVWFRKLLAADDFYVEIDLDFSSWVPFVGFFLPNDKFTVYKSGGKIRIDDQLVSNDEEGAAGFAPWKRGQSSMIFEINEQEVICRNINHTRKEVFEVKYEMSATSDLSDDDWQDLQSSEICSMQLDTSKIQVEPVRSSVFGMFASDRTELVNGYQTKVYSVTDIKVTHRSRVEHLSEPDRKQLQSAPVNAFLSVLGIRTRHEHNTAPPVVGSNDGAVLVDDKQKKKQKIKGAQYNPHNLTLSDYFSNSAKDVGISREMIVRCKKSSGQLWMSPDFPLSVSEQALPILHIISTFFPYTKCLTQLVANCLPEGFPVKLEVVLCQALRAQVTFSNAFASTQVVPGVRNGTRQGVKFSCHIDQSLFDLPDPSLGYTYFE